MDLLAGFLFSFLGLSEWIRNGEMVRKPENCILLLGHHHKLISGICVGEALFVNVYKLVIQVPVRLLLFLNVVILLEMEVS